MTSPAPTGETEKKPVSVFNIQLDGHDKPFPCRSNETVLEAMERAWGASRVIIGTKRIPVGCRRGGCGVCRVLVSSGTYRVGPTGRNHVSVEEEQQGYALACRLTPDSDLTMKPAPKEKPVRHQENAPATDLAAAG